MKLRGLGWRAVSPKLPNRDSSAHCSSPCWCRLARIAAQTFCCLGRRWWIGTQFALYPGWFCLLQSGIVCPRLSFRSSEWQQGWNLPSHQRWPHPWILLVTAGRGRVCHSSLWPYSSAHLSVAFAHSLESPFSVWHCCCPKASPSQWRRGIGQLQRTKPTR